MKIQFCDLCNESVPEGDLDAGKARRHKGRVICATCESSMSGAGLPSGVKERLVSKLSAPSAQASVAAPLPGGASPQAAAAGGATAAGEAQPPRRSRGGSVPAWISLLLVLLLGAYVGYRLDELESARVQDREHQASSLRAVGGDLDEVARRGRDRDAQARAAASAELAELREEADDEFQLLRDALTREGARVDQLVTTVDRLETGLRESDADSGKRLDELLARSMKTRDRLDALDDRLRGAEVSLAAVGTSGGASGAGGADAPPSYAAELADLDSEVAGTRWNAVQALGETGDPAVVQHLAPLLDDPDIFVRMAVARVLGDLAAPDGIEPLIDTLEDEEAVVREAAMVALQGITGRNFRFDPVASSAERAKKVKAWRSWWKKARDDYFGES